MKTTKRLHPVVEILETRVAPANVALFLDPAFIDVASPPPGNEGLEIMAALQALGHTVTTFTGVSDTAFRNALADQDLLVIPELENGDLSSALSAAARSVISNFVSGGGGLIVSGDSGVNDTTFLNTVFGFTLLNGSNAPGTSNLSNSGALNTAFAGGPATLPQNNATTSLVTLSLPFTGRAIYTSALDSTVAIMGFGGGRIAYLGWDWFDALPGPGTQDGGWNNVLGRAVQFVPRAPATLVWTGDVNANWGASNSGNTNWSGDLLPRDGDSLLFPLVAGNRTNTNNIVELDLNAITFGGVDYVVSGNEISLSGGISDGSSAGANRLNVGITLEASQSMSVTVASTTLSLGGAIDGTANLTKTGAGTLQLTGGTDKVFNGTMTISNGVLLVNTTGGGDNSLPVNIVVGDTVGASNSAVLRLPNNFEVSDAATVTVLSDGLVDLNNSGGYEDILNLNLQGGHVAVAVGSVFEINAGGFVSATGTSVIDGAGSLNLESSTTFVVAGSLTVATPITGGANAAVTKTGTGTILLQGTNTYTGVTTVAGGTLIIDGSLPGAVTLGDGVLGGNGSIGNLTATAVQNRIEVGNVIGVLDTGSLVLTSLTSVTFGLGGTAPGTSDQIAATGTVNLGGATLNAVLGYVPAVGDKITILANDGTDAITGIFNGLPDGTRINIGDQDFRIVYGGGDGNDIVLEAVAPEPPSDLVISANGRTATYTDQDGDVVTVKTSIGAFDASDFTFAVAATGGATLQLLNLSDDGTEFAGANITITAKRGADGGNGFANVGYINSTGHDLGAVRIVGDLGRIDAGDGDAAKPALKSLTVQSLGALGVTTQAAGGNLVSNLDGKLSKLIVKADVRDATLKAAGAIGPVKINGSVFGGQLSAGADLGPIKVRGDIIGTDDSPVIISGFGKTTAPTKGVDLAIKSLTVAGGVEFLRVLAGYDTALVGQNADASIGAISVGTDWRASTVLAGVDAGADGFDGTADDAKLSPAARDAATLFSQIANVTIKGQAYGSVGSGDSFGIVAEKIVKAKIGALKLKLDPGERDATDAFALSSTGPGPTALSSDFFLRESIA